HLAQGFYLRQDERQEALPAKTGVYAHDQHQIDVAHHVADGVFRCVRIEHHPSALSERADRLQGALEVGRRLDVDADDVRASIGEIGDVALWLDDHQVAVHDGFGGRPHRFD